MRAKTIQIILWVSVVAAAVVVWRLVTAAPVRIPIAMSDTSRVSGVWGDDGVSAWSKGDARVRVDLHDWAPWRSVAVSLQQPPEAALATQLTLSGRVYPIDVPPVARRYEILDDTAPHAVLAIDSPTVQVAGDRRALGVRIGALTVRRLRGTTAADGLAVLGWLLPLLAAALWLRRRGVFGLVAWEGLAALHLTLLRAELAVGYASPTLLLVSPWRELISGAMVVAAVWPRAAVAPGVAPVAGGRRIGLDLLRAIAVSCVVVAHSLPLLLPDWSTQPLVFRWFVTAGDVGVDIFFALSGYLIGAILLRQLPVLHTWPAVQRFWARRWLRTLPAAYVSAALVWLIAAPRDVGAYVRSILFVGTVDPRWLPSEMGFWWSLGAEEAFYVIAPLLIWMLLRRWPGLRAFVLAVSGIAACAFVVRLVLVLVLPTDIAGNVSYAIYARLDSMMWGVVLALVRSHRRAWYDWLAARGAAVGLVVAACGLMLLLDTPRWFVASVLFGHVLLTIGAALLIPALEQWQTVGGRRRDALVRGLALVSYSVYLYHSMWEQRVHAWFGSATDSLGLVRNVVVFLVGTLLLGTASYLWVERPVLRWRDAHYADPHLPAR